MIEYDIGCIIKLLVKQVTFQWTFVCGTTFNKLQWVWFQPPYMIYPEEGENLFVYLSEYAKSIGSSWYKET